MPTSDSKPNVAWTPGPWAARIGNAGSNHPLFVTAPNHDGLRPWCDADAHLIAAAPELYEALEQMTVAYGLICAAIQADGMPELTPARAALAKARGETNAG